MRPGAWIKVGGVLLLVMAWQAYAMQGFGSGSGTSVATFLLVGVGGFVAIFLIVASEWISASLGWSPGRRSHSMSRHLRNKRLLEQGFKAYTHRTGGLPEPPGGHDPEFLRAWVAGEFFRCERLVEMSGQEVANLPEDNPLRQRHEAYRDAFDSAREAVSRSASTDPRTSSILDETD